MNTCPSSNLSFRQSPSLAVRRTNSTAINRENRRKQKERKRQEKLQLLLEDWIPIADLRQSSPSIAPIPSTADWPSEIHTDQNPDPTVWNAKARSPSSVQHQPTFSAEVLTQENALKSCREFFKTEYDSDEEDLDVDDQSGGKCYSFFKCLFDKESDLRNLYMRGSENGEFYCIVCGASGEKLGKKYVGLVAVAQHANFISKTRTIMLHRAYGRIVCELFGLQIDGSKCVYLDDSASITEAQDEEVLMSTLEVGEACMDLVDGTEMNDAL